MTDTIRVVDRRRHPRDAGTSRQAALVRDGHRGRGTAASGQEAIDIDRTAHPGRRAHGHQHAGHGRHRHHRAARPTCAHRRDRDDERPGRGGLSASLDARGRARVPGQAVQLATSCAASIREVHVREREKLGRMLVAQPQQTCAARRHGAASTARSSPSSRPREASAAPRWRSTSRSPSPPSRAVGRARGRRLPVRRRGCAAQPQPQEQVHRGRAGATGPGERTRRHALDQPQHRIKVLLAPPSPEMAELVTVDQSGA